MALDTNLVSHWKLEESSGTRNDSFGSNHLTDNNTVGSAAGKIGNAASFIAANTEYLNTGSTDPNLQAATANDWSMSFWVFYNSAGVVYRVVEIDSGVFIARVNNFGAGDFLEIIWGAFYSGPSLTVSTWNFVVIKWEKATTTLSIRINNGTASTFTAAGSATNGAFSLSSGLNTLDGLIDSTSFWNRLLSSTEESQLWNSGSGLDYPFGATFEQEGYRFRNDDGSETTATWKAPQDTNVTAPSGSNARLRVLINAATGDPASELYRLEYRKTGDTTWKVLG